NMINGSKTFITNGHRAHAIVLVTKTDPDAGYDGFTLFLVPMDTPGVIRDKRLKKLGMHASDTALLAFADVRVPASAVLGQVGKGFYHIMWELQGERLIGAAGAVAGAQHVFDRTLQYAKERKAFGREIGHFQVIRHKFAEMATKIETARQMVYTTAWRFQNGEYPVRRITSACGSRCARSSRSACARMPMTGRRRDGSPTRRFTGSLTRVTSASASPTPSPLPSGSRNWRGAARAGWPRDSAPIAASPC